MLNKKRNATWTVSNGKLHFSQNLLNLIFHPSFFYNSHLPLLSSIITKTSIPAVPLSPPHSLAINALLNFPLDPPEWRTNYWFPQNDYSLVDVLMKILVDTVMTNFPHDDVDHTDDDGHKTSIGGMSFDEALSPLMVLLCNLGKWDMGARHIMKAVFTPKDM